MLVHQSQLTEAKRKKIQRNLKVKLFKHVLTHTRLRLDVFSLIAGSYQGEKIK